MARKKFRPDVLRFTNLQAPIAEGIEWIIHNAQAGEHMDCAMCDQRVHYYRRPMNKQMLKVLRHLYEFDLKHPQGWTHVEDWMRSQGRKSNRYFTLMRYWGLIETNADVKEDGNPRTGYWRITQKGRDFWEGRIRVPRGFWMYDSQAKAFFPENWNIQEAINEAKPGFDYSDVMSVVPIPATN
jgi:hypothetical protein